MPADISPSGNALVTLIALVIAFVISPVLPAALAQQTPTDEANRTILIRDATGKQVAILAHADEDGDGIENELEINGYYWDSNALVILPWNGDPAQPHFITDPLQASTDQDPYSDYTEVSGVNLDVGVFPPEDHPLVAARPRITVKMVEFEVIPTDVITNASGGAQGSSYTNEVSNSTTWGVEVTDEIGFSLEGPNASVSITESYSETTTYTSSTTSSLEINWENARTTMPGHAADIELVVYMENTGSTEALNVIPTVNLKLGDKILATFNLPQASSLTPRGTTGSRTSNFKVSEAGSNPIGVTIGELRAIQRGTPLTIEVIQIQAQVETLDANNETVVKSWNQYTGDIDIVSADLILSRGSEPPIRHSVFAATGTRYDPEFTLKEVLSNIVDVVDLNESNVAIEGRTYPGEWYIASNSQAVLDEWEAQQRPANLMPLRMHPGTQLVLWSPGEDANPIVNLANYSRLTGDPSEYSRILVSAIPRNNFPIASVRAEVSLDGAMQSISLEKNETGFYTNDTPLNGTPDGPGKVIVENAAGDVTEAPIALPAIYASAADVRTYAGLIPNPGGLFWIYQNGQADRPMLLYCLFNDLETGAELPSPLEYLPLPESATPSNYIDWLYDTSHRRVFFSRVRLNPTTLAIDPADTTFTERVLIRDAFLNADVPLNFGQIYLQSAHVDTASANIDLSDTPFYIDPYTSFATVPSEAKQGIFVDSKRKSVSVRADLPSELDPFTRSTDGRIGFAGDSLRLVYGSMDVSTDGIPFGGHSILFNNTGAGDRGYANMGEDASLAVSDAITLEAWISPTAIGGGANNFGAIINKEDEYELLRFDDGSIRWALALDDPHWISTNTYYQAEENKWIHVAVTYDKNDPNPVVKTYINGILFHARPASGSITRFRNSNGLYHEFRVSARQGNTDLFVGFIDDVRVWNVARTAEQIQASFSAPLGPAVYTSPDQGLIGYWRFDELEDLGIMGDGADDVRDYSLNMNHGDLTGDAVSTAINVGNEDPIDGELARSYTLDQNYPNPFNPTTTIRYTLTVPGEVELAVYNLLGQRIATLVQTMQPAGEQQIQWDGRSDSGDPAASGVYLYQLRAGRFLQTRRMVLVR